MLIEKEQRVERLKELKANYQELIVAGRVKEEVLKKTKNDCVAQETEVKEIKSAFDDTGRKIQNFTLRIKNLEASTKDRVAVFGAHMPALLKRIDEAYRAGRFRQKPLGPLGNYITLKDNSCGIALQACLKGNVYAFVCDNNKDRQELVSIMRSVERCRLPTIVIRPFTGRRHNITSSKVDHDKYHSLLDHISIEDDNVFNVIIDKTGIERIAYIPEEQEARRLLMKRNTVPRNCYQAFTKTGTQMYAAGPSSSFRLYPNDRRNESSLFAKDVQTEIKSLKKEILALNATKDELKQNGLEKRSTFDDLKKEELKLEKEIAAMKSKYTEYRREISKLEEIPDPKIVEISTYEDEIEQNHLKQKREEGILAEHTKQCQRLDVELQKKDQQMRELEAKLEEEENVRNNLKQKVTDANDQLKAKELKKTKIVKKLEDLRQALLDLERKRLDLTEEVKETLERAKESHPERTESRKTADQLRKEIKLVQAQILERERVTGDREEITKQYREIRSRLDNLKMNTEHLDGAVGSLGISVDTRKKLFLELRKFITSRVSDHFANCLEMMNFKGKLVVHHQNKTLEVEVNPKAKTSDHVYSDTRSLSGGERSFSTVAFLLALWEHCYSPFRILDEVDVFMVCTLRYVVVSSNN